MIPDLQFKRVQPTSIEARTMPTALELASDGGCQPTDTEKTSVICHLWESHRPPNIPLTEAGLLVQIFGLVISRSILGGDDIAYITSVEPLTPYLVAARAKSMPPISAQRIPLIPLLKLATFRMASPGWCSLSYFGNLVIKNVVKVARSINVDTLQFTDSQTSMVLQDLCALPASIESFGICVRGFASTTQLLVHPFVITPAKIMDLFRQVGEFYKIYNCRVSVESLVEV